MSQQDKIALITGASRGIGAALARRLAADDFQVVVNYASGAEAAAQVVQSITAVGGKALAVQADIADPAAVATLFDQTVTTFGGVDVVVNCAGLMHLAPIAEYDDASFARLVAVNLSGTFHCCREAARRLRSGGAIITISTSVLGLRQPGYGVYGATKAAVEALTQVLAQEMRGRSIRVNAVAPGPVATDLFLHGKSAAQVEHLARLNPMERLGQPDDIAEIVAFLAGPGGAWINGQTIRANGGMC